MITAQDVIDAHPHAGTFEFGMLEHWADVANSAIDADRVKDPRTLAQARALFVMHQMTKGPLNLKDRAVVERTRKPGRMAGFVKAKHPWSGTPHGDALIKAVKY